MEKINKEHRVSIRLVGVVHPVILELFFITSDMQANICPQTGKVVPKIEIFLILNNNIIKDILE